MSVPDYTPAGPKFIDALFFEINAPWWLFRLFFIAAIIVALRAVTFEKSHYGAFPNNWKLRVITPFIGFIDWVPFIALPDLFFLIVFLACVGIVIYTFFDTAKEHRRIKAEKEAKNRKKKR